jgi:hypothetical protein
VDHPEDQLDELLSGYERRKQEETRLQVQRAVRLEGQRKQGAGVLREFVVQHARDVAERLEGAGHRVVYQELLDHYPPSVRLHLWPRPGPMEGGESLRRSLEFVWGDPKAEALCVKMWKASGAFRLVLKGSAPPDPLDELWVRERLLSFVQETLA